MRILLPLSLALAILVGSILLWWFPPADSTEALLQVKDPRTASTFLVSKQWPTDAESNVFKQTQVSLMKSQFVLQSALGRRDISQLNCVVAHEPDPVKWLQNTLQITYPDGSEIMSVQIDSNEDSEEIKKVVNAVIRSYQDEVVGKARISFSEKYDNARELHSELHDELTNKLDNYYALKRELTAQNLYDSMRQKVPASEELNRLNDLLSKHSLAIKEPDGPATAEFKKSFKEYLEREQAPATEPIVNNRELEMLEAEIKTLKKMEQQLSLRLGEIDLEKNMGDSHFRILQNATTTVKRTPTQSYSIAGLGALGAFLLSTCVLTLIKIVVRR